MPEPELHLQKTAAVAEIAQQRGVGVRAKASEWLSRYGLAECAGITSALIASYAVRRVTGNAIFAAYAGAWGETLGYSTVIITRDFAAEARAKRKARRPFGVRDAGGIMGALLAEFGPAGLVDTFLSRPLAMGIGARALGPQLGLVAGKLAADVAFYLPVIFMYERTKRLRRSRGDV